MDAYQRRYQEHQNRKTLLLAEPPVELPLSDLDAWRENGNMDSFKGIVYSRRSIRHFADKEISSGDMEQILLAMIQSPQSCNRQALKALVASDKTDKELLDKLLVGGRGWIAGADKIILLLADPDAYKSPNEVTFMPYLDAGCMAMSAIYYASKLGIGSCFVNPNIRRENRAMFLIKFNPNSYIFCCAIALGYSKFVPQKPEKICLEEFITKGI